MSITDLQQQIEAVRQEAFAAGYTTAMKEVRELAAHPPTETGDAAAVRGGSGSRRPARTRGRQARRTPRSVSRVRSKSLNGSAKARRTMRRAGRGTNARLVAEVLRSVAPRALRPAEIRRTLQGNGTTISFPSIGYSLKQLAARSAAKQGGDGKSWRYLGRRSSAERA